jgi:hypothetical protein
LHPASKLLTSSSLLPLLTLLAAVLRLLTHPSPLLQRLLPLAMLSKSAASLTHAAAHLAL